MSNNVRPPIPAELRRRVLLEAGHRCAIPTCKFPDVDVHHIIPWAKSREHQFTNLIALCPNCHRRVHNGEIDRKSLLVYKSRLIAILGPDILKQPLSENKPKFWLKSSPCNYTAEIYHYSSEEYNYLIEVEYPLFAFKDANEINEILKERIIKNSQRVIDEAKDPQRYSKIEYYLKGSYHIGLNTSLIISLWSILSSYIGGIHGSDWTEVINFNINDQVDIHIEDLFIIPRLGIKELSDFSIDAIMKEKSSRNKNDVESGAGPESKNFKKFNLTPEGILLSFGEYQIGPYTQGSAEVLVPYYVIRPFASDLLEDLLTEYAEILKNDN